MNAKTDFEKIEEFKNFLDCVRIEINNDHMAQSSVTVIKLKPEQVEDLDVIKANLEVDGRTFEFDQASNKLTIDSSECSNDE